MLRAYDQHCLLVARNLLLVRAARHHKVTATVFKKSITAALGSFVLLDKAIAGTTGHVTHVRHDSGTFGVFTKAPL